MAKPDQEAMAENSVFNNMEHFCLKALLHYALSHWRFYFTSRFSFYLVFFLAFSSRFRYQHVGIQNAREKARKTQEKSKTRAQRETMFLYYTMRWVKTRVSCVLVVFWSRFGRVLVAFWSRFGHKHCQNANPTHSVIRPLVLKYVPIERGGGPFTE